jgi:hypothetical protein
MVVADDNVPSLGADLATDVFTLVPCLTRYVLAFVIDLVRDVLGLWHDLSVSTENCYAADR